MGPLSRAVAAAVLASLLGARAFAHGGSGGHVHVMPAGSMGSDVEIDAGTCSGTARPAPPPVLAGPPFDLRRTPVDAEWRAAWANAGYRFDDAAGRILRVDGKPLPDGEYRRLVSPFDAAAEPVEAILWVTLMTNGVRLDEKTCFFHEDDRPEPVTRLQIAAIKPAQDKSLELMALGDLRAALRRLPGDRPVPPDVAARLKAAHQAGAKLPQKTLDALAKGAPAQALLNGTEDAYASLTRYFDARRGAESLARGALPYVPGFNEPARPRALVGSSEERVAAALSRDLAARFSTHEAGREMLERFRGKDGVVRLPVVRVLKLSQRPDDPGYGQAAAVQDPSNGTVVINHWVAARIAVAAAPPEKRAALARELADAAKLNARLLRDPELRGKVLKGVELIVAHEFVHAWQNRRGGYDVEMLRENLPGANPLEKEHEAYREQYRYFHSLLKSHPADAVASPEMAGYRAVLSDYDGYRAVITQAYMGTFAGSSDFRTVKQVQEDRRALARRLRGESAEQWIRQGLKLVGFTYGDKAMAEAVAEDARRAKNFRVRELPKMQTESRELLPKAFESAGRPDLSLGYAVEHWTARTADADRYLRKTVERLASPTDPLHDRVRAIMAVQGYGRLTRLPAPKGFGAALRRDYVLMADEWLANAAKAREPGPREQALRYAQQFAEGCGDKPLLARVAAARKRLK
ncbi:MAG: hypothetical protein NUW21_06225 [Elusimicrobia bacterium]|nr:hypothetical protein [Elusimicrobiota bacterium]